jgi:tetratricopeptide (TPR) repeat protein
MRGAFTRLVVSLALIATYYLTLFGFGAAAPAAAPLVDATISRDIERSTQAFSTRRYSDALEPTRRLTERLPSQPIYFDRLARIEHELGQFREEAGAWEGVFRTSPTPVDACPMIAEAYEKSSDAARAIGAYERCVAAEPQNPDLLLFLGRAYNAANRAQDAQRVLEQGVSISPEYPDLYLLLGVRNFADGNLTGARARFERFLALAPERRDEVAVWLERTRQASQ